MKWLRHLEPALGRQDPVALAPVLLAAVAIASVTVDVLLRA